MEILLSIFVIFHNNANIKNYVAAHTFFMGKSCYGKKVVKQSLNIVHVELASGGQDIVQTYQCALTDV